MAIRQIETATGRMKYEQIAASPAFRQLLLAKRRFIVSVTLFFMLFALLLPVLAFYTQWLRQPAFGAITWGWVFAFAQFVMTWSVCHLYVKKAAAFDEMAKAILDGHGEGR